MKNLIKLATAFVFVCLNAEILMAEKIVFRNISNIEVYSQMNQLGIYSDHFKTATSGKVFTFNRSENLNACHKMALLAFSMPGSFILSINTNGSTVATCEISKN